MISIDKFISFFRNKNSITFSDFNSRYKVRTSNGKIVDLNTYIKERSINIKDLKHLYDHLENRELYLRRFYNKSLNPTPIHQLSQTNHMKQTELNNNSLVQYKNIIRNIHYLDILQNTQSGFDIPTFLSVLKDLYNNETIDYKLLTPSALFYIKQNRIGSVFSSFYFRASILNPYLVYSLNKSLLKGTKIFTPTLGWSSYCYGFLECDEVVEYVGTDVIKSVCEKTREFARKSYKNKNVRIYCHPSEDLFHNKTFLRKYLEHFDVVFFSPPYYELEKYPGKDQSTNRYKNYNEWLHGYWLNTIQLCYAVLKKGGRLCYILSDYGSYQTGKYYSLVEDMNTITSTFFDKKKILPMHNKNAHMTKHRTTDEKIIVFIKT
jgi:SAM-dependent methyltransferase